MEKSREKLEMDTMKNGRQQRNGKNKGDTIVELTKAALFSALFCVLAPHTIYLPLSPVGITLGSFLVYITAVLLGPTRGVVSIALYLLLGFFGLPVFSGYTAGVGVLTGPSGGFLLGYLPCVWMTGLFVRRRSGGTGGILLFLAGMVAGTVLLYGAGVLWFYFVYAESAVFGEVLATCVVPFLLPDAIKIALASVLYKPMVRLTVRW